MSTQITTPTNSIRSLISSEKMKEQFALALPKHLSPERFARVALTALTKTPKLAECTQESLMSCLLNLSALGLEPDGRRAHLIPYGNQCSLVIDWKGLAELALRSGMIAKLHADIVCENDVFEYSLGEVTKHTIDWKKPRGEMYAAYAMAVTKTGEAFYAVMSKDEIEAIRKRSRSGNSGPWVTDFLEMAKKTVFRRLSKWLPLSAEFRDALDKDSDDLDVPQVRDVTPAKVPLPFMEAAPLTLSADAPTPLETLRSKLNEAGLTWERLSVVVEKGGIPLNKGGIEDQDEGVIADILSEWTSIVKMATKK